MSDKTRIEWTDAMWNPTTGCKKVSEGCRHCYAFTFAERFRGVKDHHFKNGFDVTLRHDKLETPLFWKKPRRVFVNSMSDLFHEKIPDDFIEDVFGIMSLATQHTFQILTKRPDRMLDFYKRCVYNGHMKGNHPLPNVWIGVSVEDQKVADERLPLLLDIPAAIRFLSCEPLLGPVDLWRGLGPEIIPQMHAPGAKCGHHGVLLQGRACPICFPKTVDWVISGGECGPHARPMHPQWVRSLRDQCVSTGVPFFFKQWGEFGSATPQNCEKPIRFVELDGTDSTEWTLDQHSLSTAMMARVGKRSAGRMLDGRTWDEFPDRIQMGVNNP